ncbi:MAG: S8 family serine peptidase [Candidatus Kapaibacterium sp.]|jgi:subtilisin family serine protease|nr:S8 family serine peptidase [Candidatus Kapabacteria bacterium]
MIRIISLLAIVILLQSGIVLSNTPEIGKDSKGNLIVKGELIIKLSDKVNINEVDDTHSRKNSPSAYFGIPSLDSKLQPFGAITANKAFEDIKNLTKLQNTLGTVSEETIDKLDRYYKVKFNDEAPLDKIISGLEREETVEHVEYSYVYETTDVPNDELLSTLQHLPQVSAEQAWDIHKGENGPEIVIGIHDSGCQWDHPDLFSNIKVNYDEWTNRDKELFIEQNGRLVINPEAVDGLDSDGNGYVDDVVGYNFYNYDGSQANDPYGSLQNVHGTHVAGIAAGVTNNSQGIASISWNVKFIPTKHSSLVGQQFLYNVEQGLYYMATRGVDVINMSWGGSPFSWMMVDLFSFLNESGIILISSAGNTGKDEMMFPNSYPGVLSVASVASNDAKAYYSTYGVQVDLSAPGGDAFVDGGINSSMPMNIYKRAQGTSMASPFVAGLAALVKSYHPTWTNKQVIKQIVGTCDPIDQQNPGYEGKLGSGRINAYKALIENRVQVSREPKIAFMTSSILDQNGSDLINPGDEANLSVVVRNFNKFYDAGGLLFRIIIDNEHVSTLIPTRTSNLKADDIKSLSDFKLKISENAKPDIVEIKLQVEKFDGTVIYEDELDFVIAGGLLVYENNPGSPYQSGAFITETLESKGFEVVYTNEMPTEFKGFNGVFITLGSMADQPQFVANNDVFTAISNYLQLGGKLFIDASSLFTYQVIPNLPSDQLGALFGLSGAQAGNPMNVNFTNLSGAGGSLAQGLNFFSSSQPNGYLVEKFTPNQIYGGSSMLIEESYGTVGVQTSGLFGQRVVMMSVALGQINDDICPSTKEVFLERIIDFMGILKPIKISMPNEFTICRGESVELNPGDTYNCNLNQFLNQTVSGGSGFYKYEWTPSSNMMNADSPNPTVMNVNQNTSYKLTVTDLMYDITGEFTTAVKVQQSPQVTLRTVVRERVGNMKDLNDYILNYNSNYHYTWFLNNSTEPLDERLVSEWQVSLGFNKFTVVAVNESGCESTLSGKMTLIGSMMKDNGSDIIEGLNGYSYMNVFPTISSDIVNIHVEFVNSQQYDIYISDLLGNKIINVKEGYSESFDGSIDISALSSGTYILVVESSEDKIIKKIIKM